MRLLNRVKKRNAAIRLRYKRIIRKENISEDNDIKKKIDDMCSIINQMQDVLDAGKKKEIEEIFAEIIEDEVKITKTIDINEIEEVHSSCTETDEEIISNRWRRLERLRKRILVQA